MSLGISNIIFIEFIQIKQLLWLLGKRIHCKEAKEGLISLKAEFVAGIAAKN